MAIIFASRCRAITQLSQLVTRSSAVCSNSYFPAPVAEGIPPQRSFYNRQFSTTSATWSLAQEHTFRPTGSNVNTFTALVLGLAGLGVGLHLALKEAKCEEEAADFNIDDYGKRETKLPVYTRKQIAQHTTKASRIWVSYKHGVYDITEWVDSHPGGNKILLAAGKDLQMFFDMYAVHKGPLAMGIMETYRVGNVHPDDMKVQTTKDSNDPFAKDPVRHPALKINSEKPFNAEPPSELLIEEYNTPNEIFFVRNHLPVPATSIKDPVRIEGRGIRRPASFTVADLKKKFKTHTIGATLQCGGNRRSEMARVKSVRGLGWGCNAISNAQWTGVKLRDVLDYLGAKEENCKHVIFQGADQDMASVPYEASIPAETAFDPRRDVLLAFEMNGTELPRDHGYPMRVIIPGVVGARNVKWIRKIVLSDYESQSHFQQKDYKSFNPSIDWDTVDFSGSLPIQETPVQSAINEPANGTTLDADDDEVTVKGYAWSGGGIGIIRVDVSSDGGETWHCAELNRGNQKLHREWSWTLWEATLPVPKNHSGKLEIVCKALDASHNTQPESPKGIWNLRGLVNNSWSRVTVNVANE